MRLYALAATLVVLGFLGVEFPRPAHDDRAVRGGRAVLPADDPADLVSTCGPEDTPSDEEPVANESPSVPFTGDSPETSASREPEPRTSLFPLRLTGLVVDDAGQPIHDAEVHCWENEGGVRGVDRVLLGTTRTVRGFFALTVEPVTGSRTVFSAPGHASRMWRPHRLREYEQADVRIVLPRLATLEVTVVLPTGWAAAGADVRLHGLLLLVERSPADARGSASFALDPDGSLTLIATMYPYPDCPCLESRPESLGGRLHAGDRTEIALVLEERRRATLEVIVADGARNHLVQIDGLDAAEPDRGIVRRDVWTGRHAICLVDRLGGVVAERHLWIPSDASVVREVFSPP